jgi:uncharacterized membrane protein YfcA
LIALAAAAIGGITGMGGGVLIKPVLDLLNGFDTQTINILSTASVFAMAVVSVTNQFRMETKIKISAALSLGFGSVAGGFTGQQVLILILRGLESEAGIVITQNIMLAVIILLSVFFIINKSRINTKNFTGIFYFTAAGVILGAVSSFLGIGGGPINVAFLMYFFSFDIKSSVIYSIITILFAQASKLMTIGLNGGFAGHDLKVMPFMIAGALLGGFIGSVLNKRLPEKKVELLYILIQLVVMLLALLNVFGYWLVF